MCENAGIGVYVYDVTSDIGIPVFVCLLVDAQIQIGMYKGCGCHLDSHIALRRSICEAAQSRAVFIAGARDDMTMAKQKEMRKQGAAIDWNASLSIEKTSSYVPSCQELSNKDTIIYVEELLQRQNCGRVLVVEMCNKSNLGVVRVLASGLGGYWNYHLEKGKRSMK
jgi:ribosomal protein S12 methylthiotransferase accessory factor